LPKRLGFGESDLVFAKVCPASADNSSK